MHLRKAPKSAFYDAPITKPLAVTARGKAAYSLAIQRIVKDAAARVVADLAEKMLKDGYVQFDERRSRQMGTTIRATIGVVPTEKVLPVKERMEQLEAKLTCMCGDYVKDHGYSQGHSPVSMYDYSLSRVEEENKQLKAEVEGLKKRLEEVFP